MKTELFYRNTLIFLLLLLSIGALFGGGIFILSPSGELLRMPLTVLNNSPFHSFLIPGLILFFVLGILPLYVMFGLVKTPGSSVAEKLNVFPDMHWAWTFTIYIGFVLIIWIQAEMYFLNAVHWLHLTYNFLALAILLTALLYPVRSHYKKSINHES